MIHKYFDNLSVPSQADNNYLTISEVIAQFADYNVTDRTVRRHARTGYLPGAELREYYNGLRTVQYWVIPRKSVELYGARQRKIGGGRKKGTTSL